MEEELVLYDSFDASNECVFCRTNVDNTVDLGKKNHGWRYDRSSLLFGKETSKYRTTELIYIERNSLYFDIFSKQILSSNLRLSNNSNADIDDDMQICGFSLAEIAKEVKRAAKLVSLLTSQCDNCPIFLTSILSLFQ